MDGAAYREQSMACPGCGQALVEENVVERPIRRCRGCQGEWADEATLLALFTARTPPGRLAPPRLSFYFIDPAGLAGHRPRPCPVCKGPMQVTGLARIMVERCERDGVWFDHGKLPTALGRPGDVSWPPPPVETIPLARPSTTGSEVVWLLAGVGVLILIFFVNFAGHC